MNRDLSTALGELADRVEHTHRTTGPALPLERITTRARRRRHVRTALVSAASAAAVLVLAVGTAYAVRPDTHPAPPAHTTSATTTPTPTPTPDPIVLPTGDAAKSFGTCGALGTTVPEHPAGDDYYVSAGITTTTVRPGDTLAVDGSLAAFIVGVTPALMPAAGPSFAVVHDDVVVATGELYGGVTPGWATILSDPDAPIDTWFGRLPLTVCDDGSDATTTGRALPDGEYQLVPWADVVSMDASTYSQVEDGRRTPDDAASAASSVHATATGPATAFTISSSAASTMDTTSETFDASATVVPTCGAPAPQAPAPAWSTALDVVPLDTTVPAGAPVHVDSTMRYLGPSHIAVSMGWNPEYLVVQGGVVVGTTVEFVDGLRGPADLGSGAVHHVQSDRVLTGCVDDSASEALPAGDYTVYPFVLMSAARRWNGSAWTPVAGADGMTALFGQPFPITLTP
ncbi:hypothetical protein [Cellulomonas sp. URHB0016]